MTEQPDTAAIRAEYGLDDQGLSPAWKIMRELTYALDAARAERDDKTKDWYISNRAFRAQWDRAEAAEARIRELEQLADPELDARWCAVWQEVCAENYALEARIAAALAVTEDWDEWDREPVRRALTVDTP